MSGKAFVTGSHVYGSPKSDSDLDLVVLLSDDDLGIILQKAEKENIVIRDDSTYPGEKTIRVRFGCLDLIITSDLSTYNAWKYGTGSLKAEMKRGGPIPREKACELFKRLLCGRKK